MDIFDEIRIELESGMDDMDIYSDENIDDLMDNGELDAKEAAFMRGYNGAVI